MLQQKPLLGELPDWTRFRRPVGLWILNEGSGSIIQDLSGNGNTGTHNADWVAEGLSFTSGNSDYIALAKNRLSGLSSFTFLCDYYLTSAASDNPLFSVWAGVGANQVLIRDDNSGIDFYVNTSDGQSGGDVSGTTLTLNAWNHIVCVYDGANLYVYLNGVPHTGDSVIGTIVSNTDDVPRIGNYGGSYIDGTLRNVALYNRGLSASEIAQLYRDPSPWFVEDEVSHLYLPGGPPTVKPFWYYQQMQSVIRRTG